MLSRRQFLSLAAASAPAVLVAGRFPNLSPAARASRLEPFSVPLPIPPVLRPVRSDASGDYYELTMQTGRAQLRDGPATEIWGYNGIWPGPTIMATRGRPTHVRATNLMDRDVNIHNHGHKVPVESDGGPLDVIHPGDQRTYVYPNDQNAATYWYHDHTKGNSEAVYRGLAGFYLIDDPAEDALNLPSGVYDIPLMLQDRSLDAQNRLVYDLNEKTIEEGVFGDTLFVNGVRTPHLEVANRKYRFRVLAAANRRVFRLKLADGGPMTVIGTDGGLLEAPVTMDQFAIFNGERFDVVIDFARYPMGSSVVLLNDRVEDPGLVFPYLPQEVMRFDIVRDEPNPSDVPAHLASVKRLRPEDAVTTRRFVLDFTDGHWSINGLMFDAQRTDARPRIGTTEIWEFENRSEHPHDIHLHLVQFQILTVEGGEPPLPIRGGWKDTQRVGPHVTNAMIVPFEGYPGRYVFHCHMLEHAEHMMMGQFEVVAPGGFSPAATRPDSRLVCPLPTSTSAG